MPVRSQNTKENMSLGCFCNICDRKLTSNTGILKTNKKKNTPLKV